MPRFTTAGRQAQGTIQSGGAFESTTAVEDMIRRPARSPSRRFERYLAQHVQPDTTMKSLDIYALLKAAGQVETVLGIAAHTLFEPKAQRASG